MTQCARLLELLRHGPKTTAELLDGVPCIVHSRIAELRDRGHDIVCERITGQGANAYLYTLVSLPAESAPAVMGTDSAGSAGSESGVGEPSVTSSAVSDTGDLVRCSRPVGVQLTVWENAA